MLVVAGSWEAWHLYMIYQPYLSWLLHSWGTWQRRVHRPKAFTYSQHLQLGLVQFCIHCEWTCNPLLEQAVLNEVFADNRVYSVQRKYSQDRTHGCEASCFNSSHHITMLCIYRLSPTNQMAKCSNFSTRGMNGFEVGNTAAYHLSEFSHPKFERSNHPEQLYNCGSILEGTSLFVS